MHGLIFETSQHYWQDQPGSYAFTVPSSPPRPCGVRGLGQGSGEPAREPAAAPVVRHKERLRSHMCVCVHESPLASPRQVVRRPGLSLRSGGTQTRTRGPLSACTRFGVKCSAFHLVWAALRRESLASVKQTESRAADEDSCGPPARCRLGRRPTAPSNCFNSQLHIGYWPIGKQAHPVNPHAVLTNSTQRRAPVPPTLNAQNGREVALSPG